MPDLYSCISDFLHIIWISSLHWMARMLSITLIHQQSVIIVLLIILKTNISQVADYIDINENKNNLFLSNIKTEKQVCIICLEKIWKWKLYCEINILIIWIYTQKIAFDICCIARKQEIDKIAVSSQLASH